VLLWCTARPGYVEQDYAPTYVFYCVFLLALFDSQQLEELIKTLGTGQLIRCADIDLSRCSAKVSFKKRHATNQDGTSLRIVVLVSRIVARSNAITSYPQPCVLFFIQSYNSVKTKKPEPLKNQNPFAALNSGKKKKKKKKDKKAKKVEEEAPIALPTVPDTTGFDWGEDSDDDDMFGAAPVAPKVPVLANADGDDDDSSSGESSEESSSDSSDEEEEEAQQEEAAPVVEEESAPAQPVKTLSKKEQKKKEMEEMEALLEELKVADAENAVRPQRAIPSRCVFQHQCTGRSFRRHVPR